METIFILFLVLFIPIILSYFLNNLKQKTRNPPGPTGLPIIGNLHQLKEPLHHHFQQLSKKYGPLLFLKLGSRPVLIANSSKTAEEILKTQDLIFCSRPSLLAFKKLTYNQFDIALSPYGEYWREMRKVCVLHLLSAKRVQSFRPIREDEVSRMIEKMTKKVSDSGIINLSDKIMFLTSTIICRIAFGKRYEQGSVESRRFNDMVDVFQATISEFYFSDYFPLIGWIDKIIGKIGSIEKIFRIWDLFYQKLIDEHLDANWKKSEDGDVIDILLQLSDDGTGSFSLPHDHIKAVLMNVFFASTDTISTTIIWTMTLLIKNPTAMKKVQEEIRTRASPKEKLIIEEDELTPARLPYLNAVIKEAMRMYTPLPLLIPRETMEKCTIAGYEIPEKTLVYVNVWAVGNDPDLWEKPEEFIPERFLKDDEKSSIDFKGQDFELMPFGVGRRGCPGMNMGLATVQVVLANLLYLFDWDLPDGMKKENVDTEMGNGMTIHKKNPLCLIAKKYENIHI